MVVRDELFFWTGAGVASPPPPLAPPPPTKPLKLQENRKRISAEEALTFLADNSVLLNEVSMLLLVKPVHACKELQTYACNSPVIVISNKQIKYETPHIYGIS